MKLPLTIAALTLSLITLASTATSQKKKTCSCQSPDDSCSAVVECSQRGCTSICISNKGCYTGCGKDARLTRFTLKRNNISSTEITSALSRYTSGPIEFTPRRPNDPRPFNIDIKDDNIWNTMDRLSERGEVKVGGVDWTMYQEMRRAASHGSKISQVAFNDMSVKDALAHLSFLSGLEFRVTSGNSKKLLFLSLKEVTLSQVVDSISQQAGVKIKPKEKMASRK